MSKRVIMATLAALAAVVAVQPAQAIDYPGAIRAPQLEAKLPTPVRVYCTANTSLSFAMLADRELYLAAPVCHSLLFDRPSTDGHGWLSWAAYAKVFYHEWWHVAFQERDEKATSCGAESVYRYALRTFWGFSVQRAQAFYDAAVLFRPYAPLPCSPTQVDPVLAS